jgi:hypothetical protein
VAVAFPFNADQSDADEDTGKGAKAHGKVAE